MAQIKINLAPIEEMESPYWWAWDVLVVAVVLGLALAFKEYDLGKTRDRIQELNNKSAMHDEAYQGLRADLQRVEELQEKITKEKTIKESLSRIVESKLTRYMPVIVLEHLQNLKPTGVWFTSVTFLNGRNREDNDEIQEQQEDREQARMADSRGIEVKGMAFDNIILAEFMTLLKATRNQEAEEGDLRTQVFFEIVDIDFSDASQITEQEKQEGRDEAGPGVEESQDEPEARIRNVVTFSLTLEYGERNPENNPVDKNLARILRQARKKYKR